MGFCKYVSLCRLENGWWGLSGREHPAPPQHSKSHPSSHSKGAQNPPTTLLCPTQRCFACLKNTREAKGKVKSDFSTFWWFVGFFFPCYYFY